MKKLFLIAAVAIASVGFLSEAYAIPYCVSVCQSRPQSTACCKRLARSWLRSRSRYCRTFRIESCKNNRCVVRRVRRCGIWR